MVRTAILLVFILMSCSPGRSGSDGSDAADAQDIEAENLPDGLDARDAQEDREEADLVEALDARDAPEEPPGECSTPIRDCGPGCRQVTCMAYIGRPYTWDVSVNIISYYSANIKNKYGEGIYAKDLYTEEERKVLSYPSDYRSCWYLAMYGEKISYELLEGSEPNYTRSLHLFDLATLEDHTLLSSSGTSEDLMRFRDIDMYGDIIVWNGKDVGEVLDSTDLYMFDLGTMSRTKLTEFVTCAYTKIWGRNVVCQGWWDGNVEEVALYDLDVGEGLRYLTNDTSAQMNPDIWENRVVWTDFRAEQCADIYWCELPDCEPQPVTTNWACQDYPAIGGDWVVWQDWRNDADPLAFYEGNHDNIEIWGYNFTTGQEYQLASFGEVVGDRLRVEGGKLYFAANPVAGSPSSDPNSIFEVDLSQFL